VVGEIADTFAAMAPAWPALAALGIGALLLRREPGERLVVWAATIALCLSLLSDVVATVRFAAHGFHPVMLRFGDWFRAGDYKFALTILLDWSSVPVALTAGTLVLATCRFSAGYLHREAGFVRFFVLMLVFAAGIQLLILGGGMALLFGGWELVGLTSVLLVAFFHHRDGPVKAAIRVLVTYRLCDIGLVVAAVVMHRAYGTVLYADAFVRSIDAPTLTTIGLAVAVAAMGKSAQVPVGGWLPRAMEGPTASSAVFYGGLSVHAGVFLLIRFGPVLDGAPAARMLIVIVGIATVIMGRLASQVSSDAKTALAYATITQVGLMFIECGLTLFRIAEVHLIAHAILRYYQFLRTPSVLQDALARRGAVGTTLADEAASRWELLGLRRRVFLYRLAIERFEVEAAIDRWIVRPVLGASARMDRLERRVMEGSPEPAPPPAAAPPKPLVQEP
jgi:NADH:ubiquinone oxidoreductase subunit 5 (subunit L)/multisubunit Na+/H+ antiporter MnhA subunit